MKKLIYTLVVTLVGGFSMAQEVENLVPNPGFEEVSGKISKPGEIEKANGWISGTSQSADLFSNRSKDEKVQVPVNMYGMEDPQDGIGNNYAGIVVFSHNNKIPRSYITTKLTQPLKKGMKYCVSFNVSLAEFSKYNSNNIAAHFSKRQYNFESAVNIVETPHIKHIDNMVFKGTYNWDKICGVFTAEGGEKYITLGNFETNESTISDKNKIDSELKGTPVIGAYYYIDNISVRFIDYDDECKCDVKEEQVKEVIYSSTSIRPNNITDLEIAGYNTLYFGQGKAELVPVNTAKIDELVAIMLANDSYKIKIVSHEDKTENEKGTSKPAYADMGQKRADAVKKYLTSKGIRPDRIQIDNKGISSPVDDSGSELGLAKNRRVEFVLSK